MKREALLLFLFITFFTLPIVGQDYLQKVEGEDIITSDEVYVNTYGEYFAKVFYLEFKEHVTEDVYKAQNLRSTNIKSGFNNLRENLSQLETSFGLQKLERLYPEAVPYDTIRYNKKGKRVVVSDLSKKYKLIFDELQSFEELKSQLKSEYIRYIEPPEIIQLTGNSPNDPYYENQWTLKLLEADNVFHITRGSEDIVLGISDSWTSNATHGVHEELEGKIIVAQENRKYVPGGPSVFSHGPRIATIAAAKTDNNKGIASLGGSFKIIPANMSSGLPYLRNICEELDKSPGCDEFPDVINMSWVTSSQGSEGVINDLLSLGVVMVGASVNDIYRTHSDGTPNPWLGQTTWGEPFIPYPASFAFPDSGYQVISTTITQLTDSGHNFDALDPPIDPFQYEERFGFQKLGTDSVMIFNYGLSNNPIANPSAAFTDVAAPSRWIFTARGEYASESVNPNEYRAGGGATSEAAPLVTSIVGMMLSVNPDLTVSEVYDIITSTTDYDNIVVPPGTSTFHHPDGVRKYNKYIGYGRVNAYRAVLTAVPKITAHITSNDTWSGYVHLENNVRVENNATLTIAPGTTVLLDENVNMSIRSGLGGKLIAEGTEENPIRFIRADPDKAWGTVYLNSSTGNSVKWALFDGGSTNLTIASQNNTIEHSTFRNATFRNIDTWHNNDGGGNSSATLSHVLIEDGATVGLVAQYTNLDISNTTIQNNTQAGIYITSATVFPFHHNKITGNGGTSRDGIEVMSSGSLTMQENITLSGKGFNRVSGNGDDQISNYGSLTVGSCLAMIGDPPDGGHNHVSGPFTGSQYLVNNFSSNSVHICQNWWGQSSIQTSMFNGPVINTDYYLTSDPTLSQNPGSGGQVPSKALPDIQTDDREIMVETYDYYELQLESAENRQQVRDRLNNLYQIAGLARKVAPELDERFLQFTQEAARGIKTLYSSEGQNQDLQNSSRILYANSLQRNGDYKMAANWLNSADAELFDSSHDRHHWLHLKMDVQRYHGYYENALITLESLFAFREADGADMDKLKAHYSVIEDDLIARIEAGENKAGGQEKQQTDDAVGIEEMHLAYNYPNPFNPTTIISYQLPQNSQVRLEVFDMLGRRVALLVDETQQAGTHNAEFDASNLASGIYLYRLQTADAVQTRQMVLVK